MSKLLYKYIKKGAKFMKYLNKLMVFCLSMLFGYGVDTFGYTYTITNMSGRDIRVQLYRRSKLIKSGSKRKFIITSIYPRFDSCLKKITELNLDKKKNRYIHLPIPMKIIDHRLFDKAENALDQLNEAKKGQKEGESVTRLSQNKLKQKSMEKHQAISKLQYHLKNTKELNPRDLCKNRAFIIIEMQSKKLYALTKE